MTQSIGIYGGAFDPIHVGHLRLAWDMLETLPLQFIHLIPTYLPPHRAAPQASVHHRLEMLKRATQGTKQLIIDDRETRSEGPSYTVNTLSSLRKEYSHKCAITLILGMDAFNGLLQWHEWEQILSMAHIAVCQRPGSRLSSDQALIDLVDLHRVGDPRLLANQPAGLIYMTSAYCPLDIDATRIRECLQQGRLPKYLVPDTVLDYMLEHQLYRGAHANTNAT